MNNTMLKAFSAFIIAIVVFINSIGNFIGIGDIIHTDPSSDLTTAVSLEATTETAESTTETADAMPESKEEIVAYFNAAVNNAKSNSKSIHSNYMINAVAGEATGIPSVIDTVFGGTDDFINGFMGPEDSKADVTWTSATDKNNYFPVEGEIWASKLTAADVKDAKIVEKDGEWEITIRTVADNRSADIKHGTGHAPKAFNVVLPAVVEENIPDTVKKLFSIGAIEMNYPSGTIKVTVDPATGNVTHANYMMYWTINITLGDGTAVLPFSTENDYNINW